MPRRIIHLPTQPADTVAEKSDTRGLLLIVATFCVLAILYVGRDVLVPLMVAFLGAQALAPLVSWSERRGVPTTLAATVAVFAAACVAFGVITIVSRQLIEIQTDLPTMTASFDTLWLNVQEFGRRFGLAVPNNVAATGAFTGAGAWLVSILGSTVISLATIGLVGILTLMLLTYRQAFSQQLQAVAVTRRWHRFSTMASRVSTVGPRYLLGLSSVVLAVTILDTLCLIIVQAPYPVFFGILGGLAVLVPYLGIAVVAPFCTLLTLVVTGDVSTAALVLLVYSVVHFFEGNLFSPWLVGRHVDLNPLATLVAVIVGGELWGPVGMFLAVPVFGIIKIVCHAFSDTAWIAKLLGRIRPVKA